MNNDRRKRLREIADQARRLLKQLDTIREEEQEAVDNTPESLQNTNRYATMEQAAEMLLEDYDKLDEIIDDLEGLLWTPNGHANR